MKLWQIFRFELAYQLRRAWPWLIFAVLIVIDFLLTRDGSLSVALYEDFFLNAPFAIAKTAVIGTLFWLMASAAVAGEAAARDVATGMYPLVYAAPVSRTEYLGGRFLAALVLNALILLAVPAGILLGIYGPGVNPELLAPFRPAAYLTAYAYIALPNAFAGTAIQFALATRSGRPMAAYMGSMLLFFMGFFVASFLLYKRGLGTLLDPIGIRFIVEDVAHLWTTVEKNSRLLALEGVVLRNRLTWLAIALATLAITFARFRFAHRAPSSRRWRRSGARAPLPAGTGATTTSPGAIPHPSRSFGFIVAARQSLAIAGESFRSIAKSWAGAGILVAVPLFTILIVLDQVSSLGAPLIPATGQVLKELTAPLSAELSRWVIVPLITVFFAGELVWRERDHALAEIVDAAPIPDWVPLLGKFLGLGLLLATFLLLLMMAGIVAQAILGYHAFEVGLYLKVLLGFQLPEYLLFASLALAVHAVVNQKYIGHLVAVVAYVVIALAPMFGLEHDLFIYGAGPWWTYTEMRGLAPYVWPWLWFKLYWAAWALLIAVGARLLWMRGKDSSLAARLKLGRERLTRATVGTAAASAALVLLLGGFVFYNTNVLNEYHSSSDILERRAGYEKRYGRYRDIPQPRLASARLRVEIHPEGRKVDVSGSYDLVNRSAVAIDTIHVATAPGFDTRIIAFDRVAVRTLHDEDSGFSSYLLARPLQPGDSLRLDFQVHAAPRGFRESGPEVFVVANGTYFTNAMLPAIGYQRGRELIAPSERREHGLAPRPVIPSLYDLEARTRGESGGISLKTIVGTAHDQIAVAPGALRRSWAKAGRQYFEYSTDAAIGDQWDFASARYAVREARWNDVAIRILHHPGHVQHLDHLIEGIEASLGYCTTHFGPYPYHHVTVVEVPGDGVGIHAEASVFTHGEGVTLLTSADDGRSLDLPFAIMAHEMGHQFTAPAAFVEGAPVMSEGLAWYYAIKVVEHTRGVEQLRRLMTFMRQPYPHPPIRRGEPLLRGLDPYMSYRKAPMALYALSEYMGEERVNEALRRVREKHRVPGAPGATTLDLYGELQSVAPDSLGELLHDLFEVNAYWKLDAERVSAEQTPGGAWRVTLDVRARKMMFDSAGVESEMPMDEWVPIGVFERAQGGHGRLSAPLHLQLHRIHSGRQTITVIVPRKPALAGIDPHHLLDWEQQEEDDNIGELTFGS